MPTQTRAARWLSSGVVLAMVCVGAIATWQLPGIELENRVQTWLSDEHPEAQTLAWCRERFPERDQILISWDGSSLADPRVELFGSHLAGTRDADGIRTGGLTCVHDVTTPHTLLGEMARRNVPEEESRKRLAGILIGEDKQSPVAILVTLSEFGSRNHDVSFQAISDAAGQCGIPSASLHLGGDSVTSSALDAEVLAAAWNFSDALTSPPVFVLSTLFAVVLSAAILHSVRLGLMVLFVAALTAVVGTGIVPFAGRPMNMVLIVMPTLLIVLTMSAAIHLANYWKHAAGSGSQRPIRDAVRTGWLPCLLAALTTGIGLLSLSISKLGPIRDFGLFSSLGTAISFVVVLMGLPALLVLWPVPPPHPREISHRGWRRLGQFLARHSRLVSVVCLLGFVGGTLGLIHFRTEIKVTRYFPTDSKLVRDYAFIESRIGGIAPVEVLVTFDKETPETLTFLERQELVRRISRQLRTHSEISGAISLPDFQKVSEPPHEDAGFLARSRYVMRNRVAESKVKQDESRAASLFLVPASAVSFADWSPGDTPDEVWRIRAAAYVNSDADYGVLTAELKDIVRRELGETSGTGFHVTGTVPVFFRAQQALLDSLIRSFCLAFGVIAVAMMILLGSVRAGVLSMFPNLMPIGIVFGVLSWSGQIIDIGTMLTASVALGIAVDGALHLLTWFRKAVADGQSRNQAVAFALQHCGPAMTQTSTVIGLSLLALYPADLLLISRFGWVMATLIGSALLAEIIALPALLAGPLGSLIEQSIAQGRELEHWGTESIHREPHDSAWVSHEELPHWEREPTALRPFATYEEEANEQQHHSPKAA